MSFYFERVDVTNPRFDLMQKLLNLVKYKFITRLLNEEDVVLDVPCGLGYLTQHVASVAKRVVAVDIDEKLIKRNIIEYPKENIVYRVMDALKLELDEKFSAVISIDLIEHLTKKDGEKLVKKLTKVLEPHGTLFVHTPKWIPMNKRSKNRQRSHIHEYKYEELKQLMTKYFYRVMMFTRADEIISTGHPDLAWAYLAVCCGVK